MVICWGNSSKTPKTLLLDHVTDGEAYVWDTIMNTINERLVVVFALLLVLCGCASTTLVSDSVDGIPDDIAVVVLTAGSVKKNAFVAEAFVSYHVVHVNEEGNVVADHFLPAEKVLLTRPNGVIGKGKYGFLHTFEVPPGKYYLMGIKGRGYDMLVPVGGAYGTIDGRDLGDTDILLGFDAVGGQLNYLGEVLFTGGDLSNQNVAISDQWDRDRETATKEHKLFSDYPVVRSMPVKVDSVNSSDR